MALSALQPLMVEFIDALASARHEEQILAEIEISEESGLGGRTIEDVMQSAARAVVLGVQRATGAIQVGPHSDTPLEVDPEYPCRCSLRRNWTCRRTGHPGRNCSRRSGTRQADRQHRSRCW